MRRRAYARILGAAVVLTLIATTLAPDVIAPFLRFPGESTVVRSAEQQTFEWITRAPRNVSRALGLPIDSHSAQLWPPGWPLFLAFATRLTLITVPLIFESSRAAVLILRRLGRKRHVPASSTDAV